MATGNEEAIVLTELESLQAEMEIDPAAVASLLTNFIATKMDELKRSNPRAQRRDRLGSCGCFVSKSSRSR